MRFTHVVDACALITYLKGEDGHENFAAILANERNVLAMHAVNLCEVYYDYLRSDGPEVAERAWQNATKVVATIERFTEDFIKRVARWKVNHGLGLADSFAAATAEEYACTLITGDRNDFTAIGTSGLLTIEWVPE